MADTAATSEESPAQRQARIRREKREKKILEGGSARLDKITSMSGRPVEPAPPPPSHTASGASAVPASADPDEVDISSVPYTSRSARASPSPLRGLPADGPSEADIRALLRGAPPGTDINPFGPGPNQFGPKPGDADAGEDPMMKMLQQMMSGGGMPGGAAGGAGMSGGMGGGGEMPGIPPALASMLGGMGGMPAPTQPAATSTYIWKILHAVFAFTLAFYILYTHPFSGSLAARMSPFASPANPLSMTSAPSSEQTTNLFWVFATAQLLLQSTRFLMEKEQPTTGMLNTVAGFLPPPWGGRLKLAGRYSGIWTTLAADAMVVVFVLGVAAWWRGEVA